MALALYSVTGDLSLTVPSQDFTGARANAASLAVGSAFVGDSANPTIQAWLGAGLVTLLHADASGYLTLYAGAYSGMNGAELASALLSGIYAV